MRAITLVALAVGLSPLGLTAQTPTAPTCTRARANCERWIAHAGGQARSLVYATHSLDEPNAAASRALIMVHGGERDANHYYDTATAAAFLAGALETTVIVAPRYPADDDPRAVNEVLWSAGGQDTWRAGGRSPMNSLLTSFDVMDDVIRRLANKKNFPNLTRIVVAGHSAGGQFVNRYAMANSVHATPLVSLSYVVANPSSYAWPVAVRPSPTGDADPLLAARAALGPDGNRVRTNYSFGPFDSSKASDYNRWPAGLQDRVGYSARIDEQLLIRQLIERPTTYLLGQLDTLALAGFDSSPRGMAQGPTRRARGEAFFKYVTELMGAKHQALIVPNCGHSARCIFTADAVLPIIFPS
jgi:pimeloyl-ACP methyl ester carboxylesterase